MLRTTDSANATRRKLLQSATLAMPAGVLLPAAAALGQGSEAYASVRHGKIKPGAGPEIAKRVREGAVPVLKAVNGFKSY
jgi:hypothetical protein